MNFCKGRILPVDGQNLSHLMDEPTIKNAVTCLNETPLTFDTQ